MRRGEGSNCAFLNPSTKGWCHPLPQTRASDRNQRGPSLGWRKMRQKKNETWESPSFSYWEMYVCAWEAGCFLPQRVYYVLHISWHLYLDACTYLALGAFLITLPKQRAVGCLAGGDCCSLGGGLRLVRGCQKMNSCDFGLLVQKTAPNLTWAGESTAGWEGRRWWLVGRMDGGMGYSHCWGFAGQETGLLTAGLVMR